MKLTLSVHTQAEEGMRGMAQGQLWFLGLKGPIWAPVEDTQ